MAHSVFRKRRILFSANNGVNVVMYRPLYEGLEPDPRLRLRHTGALSHTRAHGDGTPSDLRRFFARQGVLRGVLPRRVARVLPWDVYVSPNFSRRLEPRFARLKVQIFHGVSFKNCAVKPKARRFDRLFLPGPYHRRRFVESGLFEEDDPRLVLVGVPKLDRLARGEIDRSRVLDALELDPALPTVLFAPTGDAGNALHRHGEEILSTLLDLDPPVNVIVKPHDHADPDPKCSVDWPERLRAWRHDRLRADFGSDVAPLLAAADLLLTDASSVAFEYTLLDRPIVFFDVPEIFAAHSSGRLDLDTWGRKGGVVVRRPVELRTVVPEELERPERKSAVRRAIARDLFHDPGRATERALLLLYREMHLEPPAAIAAAETAAVG